MKSVVKNIVGGCILCLASFSTASANTFVYEAFNPAGGDAAGNLDYFFASYDTVSQQLNMQWTVTEKNGVLANGFTIVMNDGPNPKFDDKELAILYFDATGGTPQLTGYKYDGTPFVGSYLTQPNLLSLADAGAIESISAQSNGTTATFGFSIDAGLLNDNPLVAGDPNWFGIGFNESIGIWFHPFAVSTSYDANGSLTNWLYKEQGFFDGDNFAATSVPEPSTLLLIGSAVIGLRIRRK